MEIRRKTILYTLFAETRVQNEAPTNATPAKYSSNLERPKRQKIEAEVDFEEN